MPDTAENIFKQLNTKEVPFELLNTFGNYISGTKVTEKPEILFARLDIKEVMERVNELHPLLMRMRLQLDKMNQ